MWKHQFNYQIQVGEVNTKPTMTIEGMTITISEMLARIERGQPIDYRKELLYTEEDEPMKFRDLTDIDDRKQELEEWNLKQASKQKERLNKPEVLKPKPEPEATA